MTNRKCEKKTSTKSPPVAAAVNQLELAAILGVTTVTVRTWEREGCPVLEKGKSGRASLYRVSEVFAWHSDWRLAKERAKARTASGEQLDYEEARRRKLAAEAQIAELELERHSGALVDKAETERFIFARARMDRDAWLQWPMRMSAEMGAELKVAEAILLPVLTREVRAQLETIAATPLEIPND